MGTVSSSARENELPAIAAEDAELMLDQHDIDIASSEFGGCRGVIAGNVLADRRDDLWWVRRRIIPNDGDDLDSERRVGLHECRPQIGGKNTAMPQGRGW